MPITGFLKISDIAGESVHSQHEDEIVVHEASWSIDQVGDATTGRARRRSRADKGPLVVRKFYDAASPYLALAVSQGRSFPDVELAIHQEGGESHLDYLIITMENVVLSSYGFRSDRNEEVGGRLEEEVAFEFEKVTFTYTRVNNGLSAGAQHETTLSG